MYIVHAKNRQLLCSNLASDWTFYASKLYSEPNDSRLQPFCKAHKKYFTFRLFLVFKVYRKKIKILKTSAIFSFTDPD